MVTLRIADILDALPDAYLQAGGSRDFSGVSIDTRSLRPGALFFAIRGEQVDGHRYVAEALARGAAGVVIEGAPAAHGLSPDAPCVSVPDTHAALIALAAWRRRKVGAVYIGVTGSSGKTTVKEMILCLLKEAGQRVVGTEGNLNNLFGLPLSLLRMPRDVRFGVFELGISKTGEMDRLAPILTPRVGVVTNTSIAHTATLGSIEGVRREKLALLRHLTPDGVGVVNGDDPALVSGARAIVKRVVTFGESEGVDCRVTEVATDPTTGATACVIDGAQVTIPLFGRHQVLNAACAYLACKAAGATVDIRALEDLALKDAGRRGDIETVGGVTLVIDCYNANPASTIAGLESFIAFTPPNAAGRRIVTLGDMRELGELSASEHTRVGEALARLVAERAYRGLSTLDMLVTVGEEARAIAVGLRKAQAERRNNGAGAALERVTIMEVADSDEAGRELAKVARPGDVIYFKASRGVALERAVTALGGGAFTHN